MRPRKLITLICVFSVCVSAVAVAGSQRFQPESPANHDATRSRQLSLTQADNSVSTATSLLKQNPAISRTHIAFVFANDVWVAPRSGGVAAPLTDAPGMKNNVMFSPDGRSVGFTGNLEGNYDIYTVPIAGGTPNRVTHTQFGPALSQWLEDGRLLFYTNSFSFTNLATQLFTVSATGGLPTRLPVPFGGDSAISADGEWLAYTHNWPVSLMENWKHYRGGMAHDLWLFNLRTNESRQITNWEGTDTRPMWRGDLIYYLSDAGPENRLNIWHYNPKSGSRNQVTKLAEYDVRNPSIGPGQHNQGEIIFQYGPELYLLDLSTNQSRVVEIELPAEHRQVRPANVDASKYTTGGSLSPTGDRIALNARGDIWILTAETGPPRNLTRTSGVFEREPSWSPDGKWIAYFSDASGEYELYVISPDGSAVARQLTRTRAGFKSNPVWSPDSSKIAFVDHTNTIFMHAIAASETRRIDADEWGSQPQVNWSPDSRWVVYNKVSDNANRAIWLYNVDSRSASQITSSRFDDNSPTFDPAGRYLFFLSTRNYTGPTISYTNRQVIYPNEDTMVAVPLRKNIPSPTSPRDVIHGATAAVSQSSMIELDGFEARSVRLPVESWGLEGLEITSEGNPIYIQTKIGVPRSLKIFDLKTQKDQVVTESSNSFRLSHDGKKAMVFKGGTISIADTSAELVSLKPVALGGMNVEIDRRAEWRQVFNDLWRLFRDYFYDENMHRIDWQLMREKYSRMLDACVTRENVNFVLSEMAGELAVGHAYGGGGDLEQPTRIQVGMLGADFELSNGAYRIAKIFEGAPWDTNARGPLSQASVKVKPGDYLLAVNNKPIDVTKDPWAALVGTVGVETTLTVSEKAVIDSSARKVVVKPPATDISLRYATWIDANRSYIARQTGGRVGYIHVPDFNPNGLSAFASQYHAQIDKDALIIDLRWSIGGSLPDMMVRMMDARVFNYLGGRYTKDRPSPSRVHRGPKCMLVSGMTVSAGENFAYTFRRLGLGKLIGTRTWGGFVGLNGNPSLIDGGYFNIPNAPFFEEDGTWLIEGHGLEPDITVINDPSKLIAGTEPQLDAAIKQMMEELRTKPFVKARKPAVSRDRRRGVVTQSEK